MHFYILFFDTHSFLGTDDYDDAKEIIENAVGNGVHEDDIEIVAVADDDIFARMDVQHFIKYEEEFI